MKERELRAAADCALCGKPFGHSGMPMFFRVTVERHGVNMDSVRRQGGLTQFLGGYAALAQVMGADEEMTVPLMEPVTVTVCEPCSQKPEMLIRYLEFSKDDG